MILNGKNQNETTKHREEDKFSSADYFETLEKIAEKAIGASSKLAYYYEERDSNIIRSVLTNRMLNEDFTKYHKHDFFELNIVMEGTLYENIGGKGFVLSKGDVLFMSPAIYHTCCPVENSVCYNLIFKKEFIHRLAKEYEKYDVGNYLTSLVSNEIYQTFSFGNDSKLICSVMESIYEMSAIINRHVDLYENLMFENEVEKLLLLLTRYPRHEYSPESKGKRHDSDFTHDDMVKYVYDNFDKINLEDTALRFGYSKSQFHRIIKKQTDYTFSELIRNIRMQRARHYLLNTNLPINNIAHLLGLESAEHFTRMFKKNRGMTPKEYRETFMRLSLRKHKGENE